MSLVLDEHRHYLADTVRVSAYERAIASVVAAGDRVLDLASGSGILGLLACRHGAGRVYAIDSGSIVGLARAVARANGFGDRIVTIRGLSTRIQLPERVDVILTDQIGRMGFEAGLIEYIADARERFLRPGGRIVPEAIDICVVPVEAPDARAQLEFWQSRPCGFDFAAAGAIALNTGYPSAATAGHLLCAPAPIVTVDLSSAVPGPLAGEIELVAVRDGTLHGLLGGFVATLANGVTMTNLPGHAERINRRNAFLPIREPLALHAGDRLHVSMRIRPADLLVRWTVSLPDGRRFDHSTARGLLLSSEDLLKTRPSFVPELTVWGRARQAVLELCDGSRPLDDIEAAVIARFPDLFPTRGDAAAFVTEVVMPYAKAPTRQDRGA